MPDEQHMQVAVNVPPELEAGTYANMLGVWHTGHEFTLDFIVTMPPTPASDDGPAILPCRLVSRVKVAPSLVFEMLQALNENMTRYEQAYGEIKRPGQSGSPDEGEHR